MKTLQLMALAILFAIAGTSFIDTKASSGSCKKHRHLETKQAKCKTSCKKGRCKTKCTPPKTTCEWNKGYPKKPKMPANVVRGTIYNLLADAMPITFYKADGLTTVPSGLQLDNGVEMIGSNPSQDDSTLDENGYPWSVLIPAGATRVSVGPSDAAMDSEAIGEFTTLSNLSSYKIESNYADEDDLTVLKCTTSRCL